MGELKKIEIIANIIIFTLQYKIKHFNLKNKKKNHKPALIAAEFVQDACPSTLTK